MSSTPKSITTSVGQSLSCVIEGLTETASVTWKNSDGQDITNMADTVGTIDEGVVDNGVQTSVLTFTADDMTTFVGETTLTYKCSVTSGQFPDSPPSADVDVVANILTFGEYYPYVVANILTSGYYVE